MEAGGGGGAVGAACWGASALLLLGPLLLLLLLGSLLLWLGLWSLVLFLLPVQGSLLLMLVGLLLWPCRAVGSKRAMVQVLSFSVLSPGNLERSTKICSSLPVGSGWQQ